MPILIDEFGIVDSCVGVDFTGVARGDIGVTNPSLLTLKIDWVGKPCIELLSVTINAEYDVVGTARCTQGAPPSSGALLLTMTEPFPDEFVHAYLSAEPGASPFPTPTLPPPATPVATPNSGVGARERIDRYWEGFGDVGCIGMAAPDSIETVAGWADLIVIARPTGAQAWEDAPYPEPNSLVTLQISQILKGQPNFLQGDSIQLYGNDLPSANVSDIDHLLFLSVLTRDGRVYYLTDSYESIFADVDGRVVTPEYEAIKQVYGHHLFPTDLDGTSFDKLVDRIQNPQPTPEPSVDILERGGYFAC